jgi:hypothetical protein
VTQCVLRIRRGIGGRCELAKTTSVPVRTGIFITNRLTGKSRRNKFRHAGSGDGHTLSLCVVCGCSRGAGAQLTQRITNSRPLRAEGVLEA